MPRGFRAIGSAFEQRQAFNAGDQIYLRVRGARAAIANLYRTEEDIVEGMREASRNAARDTRDLAFQLCPVDTERMRNSLDYELSPDELTFNVFYDPAPFIADGVAYYPPFVEFGTVNMDAQPTLLPAFNEMDLVYQADISRLVRQAIKRRRVA